ncbi:MAG: peptidase M22 [Acutalibacteraceae bacterium]|nr:peptidase M22 [Acutalibacteraceae bacterium]
MKEHSFVLGIDTSNYTTSAALYNFDTHEVISERKLLPVADGQCGLRQSDAVFHHTQQLHEVVSRLFDKAEYKPVIKAIGVSSRPIDKEGSYMPCFTVGVNAANILGTVLGAPVYTFSHQQGHIAAAIYSSGSEYLYNREFIAFHGSGGTTEAVIVTPDKDSIFCTKLAARSLDLHAGQAVDRVGVALGLSFPCGKELEQLALNYTRSVKVKTCIKGCDCCLSGIENICKDLIKQGESKERVARTCLEFLSQSIEQMSSAVIEKYGQMPVLFAGGVMSNSIIRENLAKKFDCIFAKPEFSTDNACGTCVLTALKEVH